MLHAPGPAWVIYCGRGEHISLPVAPMKITGVWKRLSTQSMPLKRLHLAGHGGEEGAPPPGTSPSRTQAPVASLQAGPGLLPELHLAGCRGQSPWSKEHLCGGWGMDDSLASLP